MSFCLLIAILSCLLHHYVHFSFNCILCALFSCASLLGYIIL
uniref:Uncharacterized protein n=1 Tax=Arundo donax TaxID=35708 RepID=A0A0A9A392_ARUDO